MSITNDVYNHLSERTTEIGANLKKFNQLHDDMTDGHYSQEYIDSDIKPKLEALRREMDVQADGAISDAERMIERFLEDAQRATELRSEDLTDDVKLLNCGVTLNAKDVRAIMRRNANNQTMIGLCMRYAKEKGLDLGNDVAYTTGVGESVKTANWLRDVLRYYRRYIVRNDGQKMLDRFFAG